MNCPREVSIYSIVLCPPTPGNLCRAKEHDINAYTVLWEYFLRPKFGLNSSTWRKSREEEKREAKSAQDVQAPGQMNEFAKDKNRYPVPVPSPNL